MVLFRMPCEKYDSLESISLEMTLGTGCQEFTTKAMCAVVRLSGTTRVPEKEI